MALRFFFSLFLFFPASFSFADERIASIVSNLGTLRSLPSLKYPTSRKIIQSSDGLFMYANDETTGVSSPTDNSSIDDLSTNSFSILSLEEYKKLNIKPLYFDSMIKRYDDGVLVEQKDFSNGMSMLHFLDVGAGYATFIDLDSDSPTEVKWSVACTVDKITDAKTCSISSGNKRVVYARSSDKRSFLIVGSEPLDVLRATYLRVDKNTPFKVNRLAFYRPNLDKILNEMTSGKMMYFRYHREYSASTYDDEISLKGFSSAYNTLNILYSRIK